MHEDVVEFVLLRQRNLASSACFPFPDLFSNELESWSPETLEPEQHESSDRHGAQPLCAHCTPAEDRLNNCMSEMMNPGTPTQDESEPRSRTWQFSKTKMSPDKGSPCTQNVFAKGVEKSCPDGEAEVQIQPGWYVYERRPMPVLWQYCDI